MDLSAGVSTGFRISSFHTQQKHWSLYSSFFTCSGSSVNMFYSVCVFFSREIIPSDHYANKRTTASSIHPHTWKYPKIAVFAALRNPAPSTVMAHRARVKLHLWHTAQHSGEENQDWNRDKNMGLWHSQDEDWRGLVWGPQGLVDKLDGGRGVERKQKGWSPEEKDAERSKGKKKKRFVI